MAAYSKQFIFVSYVSDTCAHSLARCLCVSDNALWTGLTAAPDEFMAAPGLSPAHFENDLLRPHYAPKIYNIDTPSIKPAEGEGVQLDLYEEADASVFLDHFYNIIESKTWFAEFISSKKYIMMPCHADVDLLNVLFPDSQKIKINFSSTDYDQMYSNSIKYTDKVTTIGDGGYYNPNTEFDKNEYFNSILPHLEEKNEEHSISIKMKSLYPELDEDEYINVCNLLGLTPNYNDASDIIKRKFVQ